MTESEKNKVFQKCGVDRATRNVIAYGLFSVSNIGMLAVGAYTGGTIPVGYVIGGAVFNGLGAFLKTNKNMDNVLEENKELKNTMNKLIETKGMSQSSSHDTPNEGDPVELHSVVNLPDDEEINI